MTILIKSVSIIFMNNSQTKKYAFILGRERELCLAELEAVLARYNFCFGDLIVSDNVVFINFNQPQMIDSTNNTDKDSSVHNIKEEIARLVGVLGGTVKIFRVISTPRPARVEKSYKKDLSTGARDDIKYKDIFEGYIRTHQEGKGKFNYGISSYSRAFNQKSVNNLGLSIKKDLKKELSLRFVEIREGQEVSSILSLKSKLATEGFEFGIFESDEIGILIGLSNPEEWGERDYGKPAGDKYSGMLPPKLARAMINIALGATSIGKGHEARFGYVKRLTVDDTGIVTDKPLPNCLVADPFCGSGNILLEALMLGCNVFGSDNSEKAVRDSRANAEWLNNVILSGSEESRSNASLDPSAEPQDDSPQVEIVQVDATNDDLIQKLSTLYFLPSTYDRLAIVTEPYLGEPKKYKPSINAVRGEYGKIKELYLQFLANFITLRTLKLSTVFCLIFPLVETAEGKRFSLFADSVDEIRKIGYTTIRPPLIYGRDYQVVKREIILLALK